MATEIERKFVIANDGWRSGDRGMLLRQGYINNSAESGVRVRVSGRRAWLTLKGATHGIRRLEFEYEIPVGDANQMLAEMCAGRIIEKHRFRIEHDGLVWEVDEFHGANEGLVIAEVELSDEDQEISLPEWVGREVSSDVRYYNAHLVDHPYTSW